MEVQCYNYDVSRSSILRHCSIISLECSLRHIQMFATQPTLLDYVASGVCLLQASQLINLIVNTADGRPLNPACPISRTGLQRRRRHS